MLKQLKDAEDAWDAAGPHAPFKNSRWHSATERYGAAPRHLTNATPRRCAFLSGGERYMTALQFSASLDDYAADAEAGCILPVSEIAPSHTGIRLFVEFDYRYDAEDAEEDAESGASSVPTLETMHRHLGIAQQLIVQMFPTADPTLAVSLCTPKIKRKAGGSEQIAVGMHATCSNVVVNSATLRAFLLTLDSRIAEREPAFGGVVDEAPVHENDACLRMPYAHKMERCACATAAKGSGRKRRAVAAMSFGVSSRVLDGGSEEDDDDERAACMAMDALASCESCVAGRRVLESVYVPAFFVRRGASSTGELEFDDMLASMAIRDQLQLCCITPLHLVHDRFSPMTPTADTCRALDVLPRGGPAYGSEKRLGTKLVSLPARQNAPLYRLLTELIRERGAPYDAVVTNAVRVDRDNGFVLVSVSGRNSHYCISRQGDHTSDRLYFLLRLRQRQLLAKCHNAMCKQLFVRCEAQLGGSARLEASKTSKKRKKPASAPELAEPPTAEQLQQHRQRLFAYDKSDRRIDTLARLIGMVPKGLVAERGRPLLQHAANATASTADAATAAAAATDYGLAHIEVAPPPAQLDDDHNDDDDNDDDDDDDDDDDEEEEELLD